MRGDLGIVQAAGNEIKYLEFAVGQPGKTGIAGSARVHGRQEGVNAGHQLFICRFARKREVVVGVERLKPCTRNRRRDKASLVKRDAIVALAMTLAGFYYKLAIFPFHFWTPDVYQGAANETASLVA